MALVQNNRDSLTMLRCDRTGTFLYCVSKGDTEFRFPSRISPEKKFYHSLKASLYREFLRLKGDFSSHARDKKKINLREKKRANKNWNFNKILKRERVIKFFGSFTYFDIWNDKKIMTCNKKNDANNKSFIFLTKYHSIFNEKNIRHFAKR